MSTRVAHTSGQVGFLKGKKESTRQEFNKFRSFIKDKQANSEMRMKDWKGAG